MKYYHSSTRISIRFSFRGICGKCFNINLKTISRSKKKDRKVPILRTFQSKCPLLELAKFDVILIRFSSFSILYNFENNGFSTHYFSFHTLLVPIQYQLFFSLLCVVPVACRSFDYSKNNRLLVCKFTHKNNNTK